MWTDAFAQVHAAVGAKYHIVSRRANSTEPVVAAMQEPWVQLLCQGHNMLVSLQKFEMGLVLQAVDSYFGFPWQPRIKG